MIKVMERIVIIFEQSALGQEVEIISTLLALGYRWSDSNIPELRNKGIHEQVMLNYSFTGSIEYDFKDEVFNESAEKVFNTSSDYSSIIDYLSELKVA